MSSQTQENITFITEISEFHATKNIKPILISPVDLKSEKSKPWALDWLVCEGRKLKLAIIFFLNVKS